MTRTLHRLLPATLLASLLAPVPALAHTISVKPGGSIRDAIAHAGPGDRIQVAPGVYHEGAPGDLNALTVTLNGIQIVGQSRPDRPVVLENAGGQTYGIWVSPADTTGPAAESDSETPPCGASGAVLKGFTLTGVTLRGFTGHGVHLACVDGFTLRGNLADGNQVYGLFPILSRNGTIQGNEVVNTGSDAGIYVGQSENILVTDNRVHDNLVGIEVQNTRDGYVTGNEVYGNSLGILVDVGAGLTVKTQEDARVASNKVHDNNRPNTAAPGDLLAVLPARTGILLIGADATTVTGNTVERNGFAGIGVASLCLGLALAGQPCDGLDVNPDADGNLIINNVVRGNGTIPSGDPFLDGLRADLVWDGTGSGNCWSSNAYGSSAPPGLPACP